jgi:iron-sulfur cluster repair protein YtfE (RIC family)
MTYTSNLNASASSATFTYVAEAQPRIQARDQPRAQARDQATSQTGVIFSNLRSAPRATATVPAMTEQSLSAADEVFTAACRRAQFIAAYPELGATCERLQFCWDRAVKDWSGDAGWVLLECARAANPPPPVPDLDWSYATIPELVADIIASHHRPLRQELRRLGLIIKQFCRRHVEFRHLSFDQAYTLFADDLLGHMNHEEAEVFPKSIAIEGADQRLPSEDSINHNVTSAIRLMSVGHEGAIYAMHHLMALYDLMATHNIDPDLPLIHDGLTAMAANLVMHKMKETDILLPAVLFAEEQLQARHTSAFSMPWSDRHNA